MASQKQIDANRQNAQKCTGPKTPQGKAKSSQNAMKTGLYSESEVTRCESETEYETLIAEYYRDFAPVTAAERCLVDALIKFEWLGRRYMSVEASVWERGFDTPESKKQGLAFLRHSEDFSRIDRCRNSAQRNFDKALTKLMEIQAKRAALAQVRAEGPDLPDPPAQAAPADIATEPLNTKLVSFLNFSDPPLLEAPALPDAPDIPDDLPLAA